MTSLPDSARAVLESPALAHLVTLNPDGSPQVSIVWVGLDGDEIVAGHLPEHRKVRNIRNDSRVALSIETDTRNAMGLNEYLVIYGTARITEGGAAELLQRTVRMRLERSIRRIFGPRLGAFRGLVGLVGRDVHDGGAELGGKVDEVGHRLRLGRVRWIRKLAPEVRGRRRWRGIGSAGLRARCNQREGRRKDRDARKGDRSKQLIRHV